MLRSRQYDILERMIRELAAVLAQLAGLRGAGRNQEALAAISDAERALLGPLADTAMLVDAATAAHMVGEPRRIAAWARLLRERADAMEEAGDVAGAGIIRDRSSRLAAEALARAEGEAAEVREILDGEPGAEQSTKRS